MNREERRRQQKKSKKIVEDTSSNNTAMPSEPNQNGLLQLALEHAVKFHNAGQLSDAEALYRKILEIIPTHSTSLNLLGVIFFQTGDLKNAEEFIQKSIRSQPDYPDAHNNLGLVFKGKNRIEEAIKSYNRAIKINPNFFDAHYNLGNAHIESDDYISAIKNFQKTISLNPNHIDALINLGNAYQHQKNYEVAIDNYNKALTINPNHTSALTNLGNVYKLQNKLKLAISCFQKTLALQPDHIEATNNLAGILFDEGKYEESKEHYEKIISIDPNYYEAYFNLGNTLLKQEQTEYAEAYFHKALAIKPNHTAALFNLGNVKSELGSFTEAMDYYNKAISINPNDVDAIFNLSIVQLLNSDFKKGWKNYEARWKTEEFLPQIRIIDALPWNGSSLKNKSILIWKEQGVGDEIMFSSFIPKILKDTEVKASSITIECDKRLLQLFRRSYPEITFREQTSPPDNNSLNNEFDYHVPAGSLAKFLLVDFNVTEDQQAFLKPDEEEKANFKTKYNKMWPYKKLIGISWKSKNPKKGNKRSISLDQWLPIISNDDYQFINLQYGNVDDEIKNLINSSGISIFQDTDIDNYMDIDKFSAQIAAMDLIISIDNSTVHIAGALGVPTWVMLDYVPDWRWFLNKEYSPWYSSLKLFRQAGINNWKPVITNIATELSSLNQ